MTTAVDVSTNLFDWFHQRVRAAHHAAGTELTTDTELYLANLLAHRARNDGPDGGPTTLVELHAKAAQGTPSEQVRHWRELGDRSLYTVGYFEESLSRRLVGPSYYVDMGAAAYARVDDVFRRCFANAFDGLFLELAQKFEACTRVVKEVRRSVDDQPDFLDRWYQEWLETGSDELAEKLRSHGLVLPTRANDA
jgi:hypothetical protein